ncbi:RagB/SusD family nutrient uptake outer membrane protein [Flavivirga spongiicola]|uniref:RagB/SusD family nutrient uptake outer membrane protein n=1 Tax=Flavivirga spongiicola TaxID=421621 RepID=A0ABU7XTC5_9FLAO|nr:RagB/SusD family nutrient uptake outer membrane protein [Flavivirga sp. MEBiC05379]MDO5979018.1 RagB/SusD family nutrient uptake outer membrane protein [Flavivirga sp. MEBiC05379]
MKTKKIIYIIFATFFIITGCNDDFLERPFLDEIGDLNFWKTESDLKLYLNDLYPRYLTGHGTGFSQSGMAFADIQSDVLTGNTLGRIRRTNGAHTIDDGYGWDYTDVRRINHFLANYEQADIDQSIKDRYAGEARFFRAMDYYGKVKSFGDTPYLDKPLDVDSEELSMARTSRIEVMANVVADLDFAITNLPSKSSTRIDERINKEVALHLKARICLFEGTFRKYHGISGDIEFIEMARDAAKAVIDSDKFEISNDGSNAYQDLFIDLDLNGNKEIILGRKYSVDLRIGHATPRYFQDNSYGLTKTAVDSYLCTDGLPIGLSPLYQGNEPDYAMEDEYINRDPRMDQTLNKSGENYLGTVTVPNLTSTGYSIEKYYREDQIDLVNAIEIDAPIYRYAETLLIYAEAHAELGTCTQSVLDVSVNLLRDRVAMPHLTAAPTADPNAEFSELSPLLNEIRRERKVELMLEGFRRDDLMRWKAGKLFLKPVLGIKFVASQYPAGFTIDTDPDGFVDPYAGIGAPPNTFDENKHYLYPLPPEQIALNTNLTQNPGW